MEPNHHAVGPTHPRPLLAVGFGLLIVPLAGFIISSCVQWERGPGGILIKGHPPFLVMLAGGVFLLGISLCAAAYVPSERRTPAMSGPFLGLGVLVVGLGAAEWYLSSPSGLRLVLPPEIAEIENRFEEPGVGLRGLPGPRSYVWTAPAQNIIWTRHDPAFAASDRVEVEQFVDAQGFHNRTIPERVDIVAIGDSFTEASDTPLGERWIDHLSRETGWSVYNLGTGGFGTSQEVELYARYGDTGTPWGVLIGVFGINDLGDEDAYNRFLTSGMAVKQWAYLQAGEAYPSRTLRLVQFVERAVMKRSLARVRGLPSPARELKPCTVHAGAHTKVGYLPHDQYQAYYMATNEPGSYPSAQTIVRSLQRLADLCRSQGRVLGVMYFPIKQTVHPPFPDDQDAWLDLVRQYIPGAADQGWGRERLIEEGRVVLTGDRRFEEFLARECRRMDVPFFTLRLALEETVARENVMTYFHFDTHWNLNGHHCVGIAVSRWLRSLPGWSDYLTQP